MFHIGEYQFDHPFALAPMAGVTDLPFREACRSFGAPLAIAEMITADTKLWHSRKSRNRLPQITEAEPRSIQIAGSDPEQLADAAKACVEQGAQIIDINMGCPAKKVCKKAAGSALLADLDLVESILQAVVQSVNVPVTLKCRTGTTPNSRQAVLIAKLAQACGISAIAIHGRTRADKFSGHAEYESIRAVKSVVNIPVLANGDILNAADAKFILDYTQADGLLIGRAAWGNPWIFRELCYPLDPKKWATNEEKVHSILNHIARIHDFYGDEGGFRIARKHIGWYFDGLNLPKEDKHNIFKLTCNTVQKRQLQHLLERWVAQK